MMSNGSRLPMIHYDFRATGLVVFDMLEAYREPDRGGRFDRPDASG